MSLANEILSGTPGSLEAFLRRDSEKINDIDEYGYTPIIETCIANKVELAQIVLKYGADVNLPDLTGHTALHWAVGNHNVPLCELLLAHQADPNAYTIGGQPVLTFPLLRRQDDLRFLLMQNGANLPFAQDFINTKLIGHRYQLLGQVDIVTPSGRFIAVDLEGFYLEFSISVILNSLQRFIKHFTARDLREYFLYVKKIIAALGIAAELIKYQRYNIDVSQYRDVIDPLLKKDPLIIPVAHRGHALAFIRYGNWFIKVDRGANSKKEGTVVIYRLGNPQALTPAFIKELIYKIQPTSLLETGFKQILGLTPIMALPISPQTSGNCTWANIEAIVPAILTLMLLKTQQRIGKQAWQHALDAALYFFQRWEEWDQDRALEECLYSMQDATPARKISKATLLAAILFQSCEYPEAKSLARAEKILPILTQPDYAEILRSYLTVFIKRNRLKQGVNLVKLLEDYGVTMQV